MKNNDDINIKKENERFNFRVAGIFEYGDKVLIQKDVNDEFYGLIGGKVKLNEKTIDTLKREIKEEVNFIVEEERCKLVRVCENFFEYNQIRFHEILFIYIIQVLEDDEIDKQYDFLCCDKPNTKMAWIPKEKLSVIDIRPKEVRKIFRDNSLEHIVVLK